jgi:hypothetical protein
VRLLRAVIPTPVPSLSDSDLIFYYYRYTNATVPTSPQELTAANLYFVRLNPSWIPPELIGTQYAYNRTFQSYADLVTELNIATQNEWLSTINEPSWIQGDITFTYDTRFNKIAFTGNSSFHTYIVAGKNDPNIQILNTHLNNYMGLYTPVSGWFGRPNPINTTNLNYRLGWTWSGGNLNTTTSYLNDFYNMIRPTPPSLTYPGPAPLNITRTNYAQTYACLVNTQNITVYIDWIGGSSQDSAGNSGILGTIPLNTLNNGVGFYTNITSDFLEKIPPQIYEIQVTFKDDEGNDFFLPNTAVVNLELGFSYI